jgi:hypothetical protein
MMKEKLPTLLLASFVVWSTPAYGKTWAAQFPYGSGELSPVFHAHSSDGVLAKATRFCQQNDLCNRQYKDLQIASFVALGVVGSSNLFVTTLCRQGSGEEIYVSVASPLDETAGREDGKQKGREAIERAGHSTDDCHIHTVYGVKSRSRLKTGLTVQHTQQAQGLGGEFRLYKIKRRNAVRMATEILD